MTVSPVLQAIAAGMLVWAVAACTPGSSEDAAQVAAGTIAGNAWVARAGLAGASGICLEIKVEGGGETNRLCGLHEDESGLWRFDVAGGSFVAGTTGDARDARAAIVHIVLADGSEQSATVAGAGDVTSLHFFVLALPPGIALDRLDILDGDGAVIDSVPVD